MNDVAFANPFITLILAEMEGQAIRLLFGLFSFKGHNILVLCDTSKCFLCLLLVTENIKQSLFDTVELRDIIAVFPTVKCGTVKCRDKLLYCIIGNIGNIVPDEIKHRPICQVLIFLMDTVDESLSDLLKGHKTLHTAERTSYAVITVGQIHSVTEIFAIIECAVRDLAVLKDELHLILICDIIRSVDHQTERKLTPNIVTVMITLRKCIQLFFRQMIAERSLVAGLVLFKIPTFKQRRCHILPLIT